ncbi:CHAD domain-containing protein [Silvimonas sp.]|uniref:CHAD domain-containing protein n=1 Tax=Silvimonas sp. TaxID=2650811 RepID=UPI00283B5CA2|nr:CHAD domain-containing protein [Silvimonas sp.]MDR3426323.1 CHAD domain-containing protein [Silvimonas sp.]
MGKRKQWIKQQSAQAQQLVRLHRAVCRKGDEAALHQFRIGLRSLRIQLTPLASHRQAIAKLLTLMKQAGSATNALRDRDALLELIATWPQPLTEPLITQINDSAVPRAQALRQLRLKGFDRNVEALPELLQKSLPGKRKLTQRIRQTARALRHKSGRQLVGLDEQADVANWHAARVTVKKLRYLHEHLQQWLPRRWRALPGAAKPAQEALGHLHDLDVLNEKYGGQFSPELTLYWQQQRDKALAEADQAARSLLQALARDSAVAPHPS